MCDLERACALTISRRRWLLPQLLDEQKDLLALPSLEQFTDFFLAGPGVFGGCINSVWATSEHDTRSVDYSTPADNQRAQQRFRSQSARRQQPVSADNAKLPIQAVSLHTAAREQPARQPPARAARARVSSERASKPSARPSSQPIGVPATQLKRAAANVRAVRAQASNQPVYMASEGWCMRCAWKEAHARRRARLTHAHDVGTRKANNKTHHTPLQRSKRRVPVSVSASMSVAVSRSAYYCFLLSLNEQVRQ